MRRKGYDFSLSNDLTYRNYTAEDAAARGETWTPARAGYCVIVRVKDCLDADGNYDDDLRKSAPHIGFSGWSRTNMLYGDKWRTQGRGRRFARRLSDLSRLEQMEWRSNDEQFGNQVQWDDDKKKDGVVSKWYDVYWTRTVYWVEDGRVYTARMYAYQDPNPES